jgi:ferrous iron transport protein A
MTILTSLFISVNELNLGESAVIQTVGLGPDTDKRIQAAGIRRLEELGFVPGARLTLLRRGLGGDPLAIRIGTSLFALRKVEASAIRVERDTG